MAVKDTAKKLYKDICDGKDIKSELATVSDEKKDEVILELCGLCLTNKNQLTLNNILAIAGFSDEKQFSKFIVNNQKKFVKFLYKMICVGRIELLQSIMAMFEDNSTPKKRIISAVCSLTFAPFIPYSKEINPKSLLEVFNALKINYDQFRTVLAEVPSSFDIYINYNNLLPLYLKYISNSDYLKNVNIKEYKNTDTGFFNLDLQEHWAVCFKTNPVIATQLFDTILAKNDGLYKEIVAFVHKNKNINEVSKTFWIELLNHAVQNDIITREEQQNIFSAISKQKVFVNGKAISIDLEIPMLTRTNEEKLQITPTNSNRPEMLSVPLPLDFKDRTKPS